MGLYKEASDVTREDCTICNNSPDLNNLSNFTGQVYDELKTLIGTNLFKTKAIEKTIETTNLVQNLPEILKIKVEATSSILESIYFENLKIDHAALTTTTSTSTTTTTSTTTNGSLSRFAIRL